MPKIEIDENALALLKKEKQRIREEEKIKAGYSDVIRYHMEE